MSVALRVDLQDPTPPFEQLRVQLTRLIESGVLVAGTRLPPIRQLAADLGVAAGTVARAYRGLETGGLVRSRRGGGTTVEPSTRMLSRRERADQVDAAMTAAVRSARLVGASDEQIRAALDSALHL